MRANISHSKKFIFVHISKCAGSSITDAICPYIDNVDGKGKLWHRANQHSTYREFENLYGDSLSEFFIFSFVRNPYERLLSLYSYWRKIKAKNGEGISVEGLDVAKATWKLNDFNEWVRFIGQHPCGRHLDPQLSWLIGSNGRVPKSLYIGRVEKIHMGFSNITKQLKLEAPSLKKLNATVHDRYTNTYDKQSVDIVTERFKADLDYFGYAFL